jgi:hypothetical protein
VDEDQIRREDDEDVEGHVRTAGVHADENDEPGADDADDADEDFELHQRAGKDQHTKE